MYVLFEFMLSMPQFLGIFLAAIMGLQHALAMVGGLITPPLVVSSVANDPGITQFLISSALIVSGICTIVHVIQLKIPFVPLYYGTGECALQFSTRHYAAAYNLRP